MKQFFAVIPIVLFVFLGACGVPSNEISSGVGTSVAQTQTATMWTPTPVTPSPTIVPNQAVIVDSFNGVMRGPDSLRDAIDAKFFVIDVGFDQTGNPPAIDTIRVSVECEWIFKPTCTAERAFVVFVHAFENEKVRKRIIEQVPSTIQFVRVTAFDHMVQMGIIETRWQDMLAFVNGEITGDQLASRVSRFNP